VWAEPDAALAPGEDLAVGDTRTTLEALRRLPEGFPERVESAGATDGAVTFVLADGLELRLGRSGDFALKLAVAARVLRSMSADEAAGLTYLDVSVPERAVGGTTTLDSQVEGEG
jgi:hypothetical protein